MLNSKAQKYLQTECAHQPSHSDKRPARVMIATPSREDGNDNRTHDECKPADSIGADERPTSTEFLDIPDAESFADECDDGVAGLKSEGG